MLNKEQKCLKYKCLDNNELEFITNYYKVHNNWFPNKFIYPIYCAVYLNIKIEKLNKNIIGNTIIMAHPDDISEYSTIKQLKRKVNLENILNGHGNSI